MTTYCMHGIFTNLEDELQYDSILTHGLIF